MKAEKKLLLLVESFDVFDANELSVRISLFQMVSERKNLERPHRGFSKN